jgi:hypothetical protein
VGSRGDGEERGEFGHENASGGTLMLEARGCSLRGILVRDLSLLHGDVSSGVGWCVRSERRLLSGPRVAWGDSWRGMLSVLQLAMAFICGLACVDLRTSSVGQYRMAEASGAVLGHFVWCVMGWCRLLVEDGSLCFAGVQVSPRRKSTVAWSGNRGSPGFEAVCARALPSTLFCGVCFMWSGGALRWIWRACLAIMMERLACGPVGDGGLRNRHFVCAMSRHAVAVDWNEAVGTDRLTGGLTSGPWDSKAGLLLCWVSVFRSPRRDSVAKMDSTVCVKGTRYDARRMNCGHETLAMTMGVTGL